MPVAAPTPTAGHVKGLRNTRWVLDDIPGEKLVGAGEFSIGFGYNNINGHTGCNSIFGSFELDKDTLKIRAGSTEIGCNREAGQHVEGAGLWALHQTTRYKTSADSLQLFDAANKLLATFKAVNASGHANGPREIVLKDACEGKNSYLVSQLDEAKNRGIVICGREPENASDEKSTNTVERRENSWRAPPEKLKPSSINGKWKQRMEDPNRFPLELTISNNNITFKVNCYHSRDRQLHSENGTDIYVSIDNNVVYMGPEFVITNTSNKDKNNWCKLGLGTERLTFTPEGGHMLVKTAEGAALGTFEKVKK